MDNKLELALESIEYLEEEDRWKKYISQNVGKIGEKTLGQLRNVAKGKEQYIAGIEKGTDELLRKAHKGYVEKEKQVINLIKSINKPNVSPQEKQETMNKVRQLKQEMKALTARVPVKTNKDMTSMEKRQSFAMGPSTFPDEEHGSKVLMPKRSLVSIPMRTLSTSKLKTQEPYFKRHEAEEATRLTRGKLATTIYNKEGKTVGRHASVDVIKKEKRLTDFMNTIHGDADILRNFRARSGEYEKVENLVKKYQKIENKLQKQAAEITSNASMEILKTMEAETKGILNKAKKILHMYRTAKNAQKQSREVLEKMYKK